MMQKIKTVFKALILTIIVSSMSCTTAPDTSIDPTKFFAITYIATMYSAPGANMWNPVQGQYEVQFDQSQVTGQTNGTYIEHFTSYLEPTFCPYGENCVCSGGTDGTFTQEDTSSTTPTSTVPTVYNPNSPYSPPASAAATSDPTDPTVSVIYTYLFDIVITDLNLTSGCHPEANRTLRVVRFSNGNLIMTNDYRDQYLVPVVTSN